MLTCDLKKWGQTHNTIISLLCPIKIYIHESAMNNPDNGLIIYFWEKV